MCHAFIYLAGRTAADADVPPGRGGRLARLGQAARRLARRFERPMRLAGQFA